MLLIVRTIGETGDYLKQGQAERVAIKNFCLDNALNVFTYNVVVHHDEPSYDCKTAENNQNWIKSITSLKLF